MTEANNQPPLENNKVEAAKKIAGQTKEKAKQGLDAAKEKFENAGGLDGMKDQCNSFIQNVKTGFHATEGTTSFKALISCFKNLWLSGWQGKVVEIAVVVVLGGGLLSGGGGGDHSSNEATTPTTSHAKKSSKPSKTIKPSLAYKKATLNGLRLGMPLEECKTIMVEEYGKDIIKRTFFLNGSAHMGDVLFDYVDDQTGKSGVSALQPYDKYRPFSIRLQCLAGGSFKPRNYSNDKKYETGTVCIFAESPNGLIACGIYRTTKIEGGIMSEELLKKVCDKYGKYDGTKYGNSAWLLKPASSDSLTGLNGFPLSFMGSWEQAWRSFGENYIEASLASTGSINHKLPLANAWMIYSVGEKQGISNSTKGLCMDLELIVQGTRIEYERSVARAAKRKAEILEKAKKAKNVTL